MSSSNPSVGKLLSSLNTPAPVSTKQASAHQAAPATSDSVATAAQQVEHILQSTKQASAADPQGLTMLPDHLNKIASDLESAETMAMIKEAQLMGAAMADSFMAQINRYGDVAQKIAAVSAPASPHGPRTKKKKKNKLPPALKAELNKQATVNEVKIAAESGARDARTLMQLATVSHHYETKTAEAVDMLQRAYNAGVQSAVSVLFS